MRGRLRLIVVGFFLGSSVLPLGAVAEGSNLEDQLPEAFFAELDEILEASADRSWRMIEEGLRVSEARGEAEVLGAGRYPTVSGSLRVTGRLEDREDFDRARTFYQPQAGLTVRQPIYHWGSLRARSRIGEIRQAMAKDNRAEVYRNLALGIRGAFLDLVVREEWLQLAKRQLAFAEEQRQVAEERFGKGEITPEASAAFRLAEEEARLRVERLRGERRHAVEGFEELTGQPFSEYRLVSAPLWAKGGLEALSPGEVRQLLRGKAMRPGSDLSRGRVRQAEEQYRVEKARNRPRLNVITGVAQDQVAVRNRSDIDRTVLFAGLELTWDIFDGFESRGRRSSALANKRLEEMRHERQEREWSARLARLVEELEWATRQLNVSRERLELGEQEMSDREEDLERGLISEVDMAAARVDYAEVRLAVVESRAEYFMAVAEVLSESGRDPVVERVARRQW